MGKRGPKKTPAPIKKARGTYRPDRDGGYKPEVPSGVPVPPEFLDKKAIGLWARLGPGLVKSGLLTTGDSVSFALLCEAWADWQNAMELLKTAPLVIHNVEKGSFYQHPAVGIRNRAWLNVLRGCQEFGLTPSSRGDPKVEKWDEDEEADPETKSILGM